MTMSPNLAGAFLMMASMACFTLNDTLIKLTAQAVPLFQLIFLRGLLTCGLILAGRNRMGGMHFRIARRDWIVIACRTLAELTTTYFFLQALFHMPLANVTAILQVVPLAVTLASALILREAVGWRRMLAIAIGFFGVMLIIRPGPEGFTVWSIYALIAVLGVTARDLVTRKLSPEVPSMTVTFVTAFTILTVFGLASIGGSWVAVDLPTGMLIAGSAVFIMGGYFFSIQVMRTGEVSFTAPFRYTGLVWALVLGWVFFSDWPSFLTMVGAVIVVVTGLFSFYREQQLSKG